MDTYVQAPLDEKRHQQNKVVELLVRGHSQGSDVAQQTFLDLRQDLGPDKFLES